MCPPGNGYWIITMYKTRNENSVWSITHLVVYLCTLNNNQMTQDEKDDVIFNVTNDFISQYEKEMSKKINSIEFKMELKKRLKEKNVNVDYVNMDNTETINNLTFDKYSVFLSGDFYEDLNKDLVIH